jgi:NAD(P)-dependent dehydrogenase (short-subunit alcohol dehydrogenase family)
MSHSFNNKIAIVTGSGRGIGRAIVKELCQRGAKVVLNDINEGSLNAAVEGFRQEGYEVTGCLADVTQYADCEKLVQTAVTTFGGLDILINNAGVTQAAFFKDITPESYKRILDIGTYGAIFPTKAALNEIISRQGSIVFISSVMAFYGTAAGSGYAAGKRALTGLAQCMRLELADTGIHIGLIYPTLTRNDPEKTAINANGEIVSMPPRPTRLQIRQEDVALAVIKSITHRRKSIVVSFSAKFYVFMARFFPGILFRILVASQRKMSHLYAK